MATARTTLCVFAAIALLAVSSQVRAEGAAPEPKPADKGPKIAVQFNLTGVISEQSSDDDDPFSLFGGQGVQAGVRDVVRRLEKAAETGKVACVLLNLDQPALSWEHVQDLRQAILKIKQAGKPVIAYAESLDNVHYLLAGAADKIYVSPGGVILLKGLYARQMFLKGTLDKLGLQADLYQMGTFKGAAEPFTLTAPSKETEAMMNWLLDDWYVQLCEQVGRCRGKDAEAGMAWLIGGPYTAKQAVMVGLIDGVSSRLDVVNDVKRLAGLRESDKLECKFAEKKRQSVDFTNPFAFFKIFAALGAPKLAESAGKPAVGLIYAEGLINSGQSSDDGMGGATIGSASLIATIEKARKDAEVKAVVLRIESPGGSALASEAIHDALVRLKASKPLMVSMGTLAASGGYYIAAPAERIFAHPTSLVGSIGVVGGKIVMKGFYDWIGVTSHEYSRGGEKAGMLDPLKPFNAAEKGWILAHMKEVYDMFVKAVKDGRGERLQDFETKIAGGKIFTGRQALRNGLVDDLGGLDQALACAAEKAGLKPGAYQVRVINKRLGFTQRLLKSLSGESDEDDVSVVSLPNGILKLSQAPAFSEWLTALRAADPACAAVVGRQLQLLQMVRQNQVLMMMPFEIGRQ